MDNTKNTSVTLAMKSHNAMEKAARKEGRKLGGLMRYLLAPFISLAERGEFERITLLRKKLERDAAK